MKKYYESIWFWWIILTGIYAVFNVFGYPAEITNYNVSFFVQYISAFLGLFVPFGLGGVALMSLGLIGGSLLFVFLPIIIFLFLMFSANKWIQKLGTQFFIKFLLILFSLILITCAVDFARGEPFESWSILLKGGTKHYCC